MASVTSLRKLLDAIVGEEGSARSKFVDGTVLQTISTLTLGQPFEVWKTRMGRHRTETTVGSFRHILHSGGVRAFYAGTGPKLVESATKGGVLLVALPTGIVAAAFSDAMQRRREAMARALEEMEGAGLE